MKPVSVFKKKYHVDLRDVDFTKKLKLSALFNYLQEISSLHVENLGIGIEAIEKRCGASWILMRAKAEVVRYPAWDEDITIETWQQEPKKVEFEKDFIVRDAEGIPVIRVVSMWLIIDSRTRQLKRSEEIAVPYPPFLKERALSDPRLGKIRPFKNLQRSYVKKIGYSDTDINGHINNAKYIDLATDCFPVEKHSLYHISSMQINYMREALPGESVVISTDVSELDSRVVYIEGIREVTGEPIFNTMVRLQPAMEREALKAGNTSAGKPNWGFA